MTYNSSLLLEVNFKWQIYHIPRVFFSFFLTLMNISMFIFLFIIIYIFICIYVWELKWACLTIVIHCMYDNMFTQFIVYATFTSDMKRAFMSIVCLMPNSFSFSEYKYCLMDSANIPSGPPNCTCKKCVLSYNVWLMKILIHAGIKAFKLPIISWSNKSTDWIRYENTCNLEFVVIYTLPQDFASTTFRLTFR